MTFLLDSSTISELVEKTLSEDIQDGDITTRNIFVEGQKAIAEVIAREPLVLCGLDIFQAVFKTLTSKVAFTSCKFRDGDAIAADETIIKVECDVIPMLEGERSALNILQWLSGIATLTQKYVKQAAPVEILDTRKTTPGLRVFEKYAVKCGGGTNHRFGLYDQVLIKDNHIEAAGSISKAVSRVRGKLSQNKKIEVEVKNLDEVEEAVKNQVDIIMLDNMDLGMIQKSISLINGKSKTEISGGVTYEKLAEISKTGADYVSVGALTHSAPAIDISMNITTEK
ncbi:MAG: carboxylating nicotinate-nucleotide diphosphorylase [Nitrospinae bacterium]|nr:carboxylating nicotinate-nucleotide diphosphorylase [Nitrospinota bacterium]